MAFQITDPTLDEPLDRMAAQQPAPTSRTRLATAILNEACRRFDETGDPLAWRFPSADSAGAQGKANVSGSVRPDSDHSRAGDGASSSTNAAARKRRDQATRTEG